MQKVSKKAKCSIWIPKICYPQIVSQDHKHHDLRVHQGKVEQEALEEDHSREEDLAAEEGLEDLTAEVDLEVLTEEDPDRVLTIEVVECLLNLVQLKQIKITSLKLIMPICHRRSLALFFLRTSHYFIFLLPQFYILICD